MLCAVGLSFPLIVVGGVHFLVASVNAKHFHLNLVKYPRGKTIIKNSLLWI
jgi:hypothetical protein